MFHIKNNLFYNLNFQIFMAMIIGVIVGLLMKQEAVVFEPLGTIFIHLIKMLVVPLISVSIISGAASIGTTTSAGKIAISTFVLFLITSALAVVLALLMGEYFKLGIGIDLSSIKGIFSNEYINQGKLPGFFETITGIIPTNIFQSLTNTNILQILFFCLFLGFGISKLKKEKAALVIDGLNSMVQALIWMMNIIMKFISPIGVFGLMSSAIGTYGFDILKIIINLFWVYCAAIIIFGFLFFPGLIKLFSSLSPIKFIKAMKKPQTIALSTASSMGALPVTMQVCEEELNVSKSTSAFVLPLGATINMSGNAIYNGLVAVFFAQIFHINLGFHEYLTIIITATLGAIGQAGVPGPSLLVVAVLLSANIPIVGLPLLFAIDRIFDMTRTALNITGDAACAVIVDEKYNRKKIK